MPTELWNLFLLNQYYKFSIDNIDLKTKNKNLKLFFNKIFSMSFLIKCFEFSRKKNLFKLFVFCCSCWFLNNLVWNLKLREEFGLISIIHETINKTVELFLFGETGRSQKRLLQSDLMPLQTLNWTPRHFRPETDSI